MAARLARGSGPEQLRELVVGRLNLDAEWRDWCKAILGQQSDLIARLQQEALRAGTIEGKTSDRLRDLGTDREEYWAPAGSDAGFDQWLRGSLDAGELTPAQAQAVARLREARLARLSAMLWLGRDLADLSQGLILERLLGDSPMERWAAAHAILGSENGFERLLAAARLVPATALIPIAQVAQSDEWGLQPAQLALLWDTIREQLTALRSDQRESRSAWLRTVWALSSPLRAARACLLELGRPEGDPTRDTALGLLAEADPDQQGLILRALKRWLELIEPVDADAPNEPAAGECEVRWTREFASAFPDPAERIRADIWLFVLGSDEFPDKDLLRALYRASAAEAHEGGSGAGRSLLADSSWTWRAVTNLIQLAVRVCGAASADLLVRALRFKDVEAYGAAFNGLLSLGAAAVPALKSALRSRPHRAIVSVLQWMGVTDIADELVACLESDDAFVRREAVRVLSLQGDARVLPKALELARSADGDERCLALHSFYHLRTSAGLAPAIACLTDPYLEVRQAAYWAILRTDGPERLPLLSAAVSEGPLRRRLTAVSLIAEIGGAEAARALPAARGVDGKLREALQWARKAVRRHDGVDEDRLPEFRNPMHVDGPLPEHWELYFDQMLEDPELLAVFDDRHAGSGPLLSDEKYLWLRERCLADPTGQLVWFLHDTIGATAQLRRVPFALYHGVEIADEASDQALHAAFRRVDGPYLAHAWARSRPDLVLGGEDGCNWIAAVIAVYGEKLVAACRLTPRPALEGRVEDAAVLAEWVWLRMFPDEYWGLSVRPALPLGRLARYAARHFREASSDAITPVGRATREIVDYLAIQCTVQPVPEQWRSECREALWECFEPLREKHLQAYSRETKELTGDAPGAQEMERYRKLIHGQLEEALAEYDAFFGSPPEPLFPLGFLMMRSADGKLPKWRYGRGVPFAHFLAHRLARALPISYRLREQASADPVVTQITARKSKGRTRRASQSGPDLALIIDGDGKEWVSIQDLARLVGLSVDVLRSEETKGYLAFERRRGRRVVPHDLAYIGRLRQELLSRSTLRRKGYLARLLGVSVRTLLNWEAEAPASSSAEEILKYLFERARQRSVRNHDPAE